MKNFKLAYMLKMLSRYEEELTDSESYIDLFYSAINEMSEEDKTELIYHLINNKLYNNDWDDLIDELDDNYIIEKIEEDNFSDVVIMKYSQLKEIAEVEGREIYFENDGQEWLAVDGVDFEDDDEITFDLCYNLEGQPYYLIEKVENDEEDDF